MVDVADSHEALDGVGVVLVEHGQVALSELLVVSGHGEAPSFSSDASTTSNDMSSDASPPSDAIVTAMTVTERQQRDRAHRRQAIITAARQLAEA